MRVDVSNQLKPDVYFSIMHFMKIAVHKIRSCFAIWVVRFLNHRRLMWVQLGLSSVLSLGSRMEREARTGSVSLRTVGGIYATFPIATISIVCHANCA